MAERLGSFVLSLIIGQSIFTYKKRELQQTFLKKIKIDLCVYKLCKHVGKKPTLPMLLVATSQVTLAYYTHPFSNSFESILLCLCLCTYADYVAKVKKKKKLKKKLQD